MSEFDKVLEDIKRREIDMGIEIAKLQADRDCIKAELRDCINELCCYCPKIQKEHLGACDGCRWKKIKGGWT